MPEESATEAKLTYLEKMNLYPKCGCGQGLWAPVSVERGFCEGCRIAGLK